MNLLPAGLIPGKIKRFILPLSAAIPGLLLLSSLFLLLVPAGDGSHVQIIDCAKGASLSHAAGDMKHLGIIRSATALVLLAKVKGQDTRVQAGAYKFNDGMKLSEILRKMVDGDVYAFRFAVPEGYSLYQLAELLEARKIHSKADFLAACSDRPLLTEFGIPGGTVEGYLFPATYNILPTMKPLDTVRMMLVQFEKSCNQLSPLLSKRDQSRHRLVTLASLVEKEAVKPDERPLIASVFVNRLNKGMRLQSDPTAVYGIRPFAGKITRQDILRSTPYNTYKISALPPGPIGNPGSGALQAVLNPKNSSYFYFVAKNDGTHFFSTTLDQHNMAVTKYLKGNMKDSSSSGRVPGYNNDNPGITGGR